MNAENTVRLPGTRTRDTVRDIRKTALDPNFWYPIARARDVAPGGPGRPLRR